MIKKLKSLLVLQHFKYFFSTSGSIAAALFCFVPQMSFVSDFYGMNFAFVLQTEAEGIFKKVARATLELPYCL